MPALINLHPNGDCQKLHRYPFAVNLNRRPESCNILDDLSSRICVNETEDWNLHVFNMIIGIKESKPIRKHISCKCECKC